MSYRLITKATMSLNTNASTVEIRSYASPKAAPTGFVTLNGETVPFKLTGGQGRGAVVRCYMYFPYNGESAYVELTQAQFADVKAAHTPIIYADVASPAAPDTLEDIVDAVSEAVEAPKAKRAGRKAKTVVEVDALV